MPCQIPSNVSSLQYFFWIPRIVITSPNTAAIIGPFIRELISRERNYLYEYKLPGQDKPRLEKVVNVDFVPFIRGVRGLRKPRPELAAAYFLS